LAPVASPLRAVYARPAPSLQGEVQDLVATVPTER